jgi:hypothetical protein
MLGLKEIGRYQVDSGWFVIVNLIRLRSSRSLVKHTTGCVFEGVCREDYLKWDEPP